MKSNFLALTTKDFFKGLVVAVLTGIITFLTEQLQTGTKIDLDLFKMVGISALIALCAYLIKNLFTNKNDEILKTDKK